MTTVLSWDRSVIGTWSVKKEILEEIGSTETIPGFVVSRSVLSGKCDLSLGKVSSLLGKFFSV